MYYLFIIKSHFIIYLFDEYRWIKLFQKHHSLSLMTMIIRMMTIARLTFRPCLKVNNSTISLLFNQLFYSSHHHHGHSSNFLLESFGSKKSSSRKIKEQSPNYFFCVRVNNNQVRYAFISILFVKLSSN